MSVNLLIDAIVRQTTVLIAQLATSAGIRAPLYSADSCVLEVGDRAGWEGAVLDHYQAMVTAICTKLNREDPRSTAGEVVGGSTYGFTVWDGHPYRTEALAFLERNRRESVALCEKVHQYNATPQAPSETVGVITYFGQAVVKDTTPKGEDL